MIGTMTEERYEEASREGKLKPSELMNGWHFCCELDYAIENVQHTYGYCDCLDLRWVYLIASAYGEGDESLPQKTRAAHP